jgi:DNA-binding response OmpR family regulator
MFTSPQRESEIMSRSILIIEDEADIRRALMKVLDREGFSVEAASFGEHGVELARNGSFDLIITDIIMPGIDGVETIRQIRATAPGIKVIAISGGGNGGPMNYEPDAIKTDAYLAAADKLGADRLFTKPFEREEILSAVRELLDISTN